NIYLEEPADVLYLKYYNRNFPIASPPFSTITPSAFDFTPDNLSSTVKVNENHFRIIIDKPGFYQLTNNQKGNNGATYFFFDSYYPEPKSVLHLAEPLRYISTNEEYNVLFESDELKKAVDAHWIKVGGTAQRARELIKAYYSRVQLANRYFTSYLEGWKSDRGMCYIVFGPPDEVYRTTSSETWIYGESGKYKSLSLTFTKVANPFSFNDFRLNRSNSLKNPWYRAVEFWRQGRVLTYK
ncbi:MAG: GWxTD domain-containing protein, partial [Salibacteraceae bacterium]